MGLKLNSGKTNRKQIMQNLLSSFFTKREVKEFNRIASAELNYLKSFSNQGSVKNIKQIKLAVDNEAELQIKIDLLITFAQKKLKSDKYSEFLCHLGDLEKTSGDPDLAIMIYKSVLNYKDDNQGNSDSVIADVCCNLCELYRRKSNWDICFSYIAKAKEIYKLYGDDSGLSRCYNILGTVYGEKGNFIKAKHCFESSLKLLANSKNLDQVGKTEINLGIVNEITGDLEKAMTYYRMALFKFTKKNDIKRLSEIYHNLGMLSLNKNNLKQAIYDFDNSIHFCTIINYLPVMGIAYLGKSIALAKKNDLKSAEEYADKAAALFNKTKDRMSAAEVYKVKGIIYREKKKYSKAEFYFSTSLRLNIELGNKLNEAETNVELGILLKQTGETEQSNDKLSQALLYYRSIKSAGRISEIESLTR
jgi:tetratricopeptide (TPR) repeat protein